MSITQTQVDRENQTTASLSAPPLRVLPPESPLHMQKQELLPSPVMLQRTFWRQFGDAAFSTLAWPMRFSRAMRNFVARPENGIVKS